MLFQSCELERAGSIECINIAVGAESRGNIGEFHGLVGSSCVVLLGETRIWLSSSNVLSLRTIDDGLC